MEFIHRPALFTLATLAFFAVSLKADEPIPIRVVVITAFQNGEDNDPTKGEFGNWVLNLPLPQIIPFPQGYHHLRYNPELQVLGIVTGQGKSHAAASIMGLGMDPRFDLSKAYWIVAAIAGVNPNSASVASTAWAKFVVDGDLSYQIDARQIPQGWPTGYVPLGRSRPYGRPYQPFESNGAQQVYQLNASLADWAFQLTEHIHLPDDSNLQKVRSGGRTLSVTKSEQMKNLEFTLPALQPLVAYRGANKSPPELYDKANSGPPNYFDRACPRPITQRRTPCADVVSF